MSINRADDIQINGSRIFDEYKVSEGSSRSFQEENQLRRAERDFDELHNFDLYSFKKPYKIPLKVVRSKINKTYNEIESVYNVYESILENVFINPYSSSDLEECHFHLWDEIQKKYSDIIVDLLDEDSEEITVGGSANFDELTGTYKNTEVPQYISFKQYIYAEEHGCRGCRKFVKEYDKTISHSMFVHFFDFRYYLKLLLHEANCIKESLLYDFGTDYDDESQEQTAIVYFSWAKMAENHTKLIAEELKEQKRELPASEVDHISKKQAAQFQAFFSIRVAAYTETIDNILFSMKKYLVDTCEIFYKKHVSPALKFKTHVAAPLELDILTTAMQTRAPVLSEEIVTAVTAFKGNFGAILTDMVQRRDNIQEKFDNLFSFNRQRKKYIDYIDQLSSKASSRPKIITTVKEDKYSKLFDRIVLDPSERMTLKSSHGNLDGLTEDNHPQYLLRSGGTIFGDIYVQDGVTIDGVDLSAHAHTGEDGSVRIKSTDIDYETPREETTLLQTSEGNLISVNVDSFSADIRTGGVPVVNAVVNITVPDGIEDQYEFEIIYMENPQ